MRIIRVFAISLGILLESCAAPPHLPIVHSYGELLAQKPTLLEAEPLMHDPANKPQVVPVRLGQSAVSAPVNSAVLLYCAVENYDILSCETSFSRFGPLWVSQSYENGPDIYASEKRMGYMTHGWETTKEAKMVLVRTVAIDRPGKYDVKFTSVAGKLIAETTIIGTKEVIQPWLPLKMVKEGDWGEYSDRHEDGTYDAKTPIEVAFPGGGAALPAFTEYIDTYAGELGLSLQAKDEVRHKLSDPLPTLVGEKPTLKLEKEGDVFTITSPDIQVNTRVDFAYLTRWWVNDKPFVPSGGKPEAAAGSILLSGHRVLPFVLHLDPHVLGAKPGDRVSLQMLYCGSWKFVSRQWNGGGGGPGDLTNRVSWIVPP